MIFSQASKGCLDRGAVSGQHETVKELLESGEDVDQSDEVLVLFSLCKTNFMPGLSRSSTSTSTFIKLIKSCKTSQEVNNKIGRTV